MMRGHRRPNNERKFSNMKNRNTQLTAVLFVVALALVPSFKRHRDLTVVLPIRR